MVLKRHDDMYVYAVVGL